MKTRKWLTAIEADPRLRAAEVEIAGFISVLDGTPEDLNTRYVERQIIESVQRLMETGYLFHESLDQSLVFTLPETVDDPCPRCGRSRYMNAGITVHTSNSLIRCEAGENQ